MRQETKAVMLPLGERIGCCESRLSDSEMGFREPGNQKTGKALSFYPYDIVHTPFPPGTDVEVIAIEPPCWPYGVTILVRYLTDYAGYVAGSLGRYCLKDFEELSHGRL